MWIGNVIAAFSCNEITVRLRAACAQVGGPSVWLVLANTLDAVVEDCVNAVGVDVNTASAAILGYIAGLNKAIAQQIVEYRKENGRFDNRQALCGMCRAWASAPLSRQPASCAFRTVLNLWMPPQFTLNLML